MAPDLDLLVGLHSRQTHSIGAALLVFAGAWLVVRGRCRRPAGVALALGLSYGSHVLLDWLATDTSPPIGIMALWPFSSGFYLSPVTVFMGISRKYWLAAAWTQNAASVAWELLAVVPLTGAALWLRRPAAQNLPPRAGGQVAGIAAPRAGPAGQAKVKISITLLFVVFSGYIRGAFRLTFRMARL